MVEVWARLVGECVYGRVGGRASVGLVGERVDGVERRDGHDLMAAERTLGREAPLSLCQVPLQGTTMVEDVGGMAAEHGRGRGRVGDGFVADSTAQVGSEGELTTGSLSCTLRVGLRV